MHYCAEFTFKASQFSCTFCDFNHYSKFYSQSYKLTIVLNILEHCAGGKFREIPPPPPQTGFHLGFLSGGGGGGKRDNSRVKEVQRLKYVFFHL